MWMATSTPKIGSFVDGNVYTKKRQFRTALSWKLDDNTTTELRPRGDMTQENLLLSFVTRIEDESWWAPVEDKLGRCAKARPRSAARGVREEPPPEHVAGRSNSILELLRLNDHPPGRLTHSGGRNYRWDAPGRPCLFAQLRRPDEPRHGSNGAAILFSRTARSIFVAFTLLVSGTGQARENIWGPCLTR